MNTPEPPAVTGQAPDERVDLLAEIKRLRARDAAVRLLVDEDGRGMYMQGALSMFIRAAWDEIDQTP